MVTSILAGIVDRNGGVRVVVTSSANIHCHVGEGERCYVVPDVFLNELPSELSYPALVSRATAYVQAMESSHGIY